LYGEDGPVSKSVWSSFVGSGAVCCFRAQGFGGQLIHVVPDLDLVTVITSDAEKNRNDAKVLIDQDVLPAVRGQ
jgi:hypothetical protein